MNKPLIIWQFLLNHLQQKMPVMLLYVLESKGSSPGRQGFFMAVGANGLMEGSIGGGVMEHKFVELAKERLQMQRTRVLQNKEQGPEEKPSTCIRKQIHDKRAAKNQSGMICSGEQTVLMHALSSENIPVIQSIVACLHQMKNGCLQLSPNGISFQNGWAPQADFYYQFNSEENWFYEEKIGFKNHLFIIGAGHCALAFSKIMAPIGFYIHLFDDRRHLNTFEQNNYVHEKKIVADFSELKNLIPPGNHNYVVIMSFGYRTDDLAVRALLEKEFAYLGLLGSAAKIDKMFAAYRKEGIAENDLQKIYAPIGFPINSQTPEEIAISIAAQIIGVKNRKRAFTGPVISKRECE